MSLGYLLRYPTVYLLSGLELGEKGPPDAACVIGIITVTSEHSARLQIKEERKMFHS